MTGALYPAALAQHGPLRSLEQLLAELVARYDALPMQHRDRGPLAVRIREVEAAIDERGSSL